MLDLAAGINFGSWHLRQRSSVEVSSDGTSSYQNIATYLAHDIPSIRSDLTVGDSFTDGAVFDSFGFRGVSLASDDQMLPDSQLEYAPVVHGIARTNARVVITQNGNTILETTVSPGAFEINDLYATGYGGDLHVTVYEADGTQDTLHGPVCLRGAAAASRACGATPSVAGEVRAALPHRDGAFHAGDAAAWLQQLPDRLYRRRGRPALRGRAAGYRRQHRSSVPWRPM